MTIQKSDQRKTWPRDHRIEPHEVVEASCPQCDQPWDVHDDMSGYRMQCDCGYWIDVPWSQRAIDRLIPIDEEPKRLAAPKRRIDADDLVRLKRTEQRRQRAAHALKKPAARRTTTAVRQSQTNRAVLDLVGILLAFWVPAAMVTFMYPPTEWTAMMPFAGLASSVFVVLLALSSGTTAFQGLRRADSRAYIEAIGTAIWAVVGAYFYAMWMHELYPEMPAPLADFKATLGLPLSLLVVAVLPGVFEELAFRGLLQGRLATLFGRRLGILLTATAFALAHGVTMALPLHFVLGLWLSWARAHFKSLLPGMLFHVLYNGAVVIWIT